jgi:hypothetical protein
MDSRRDRQRGCRPHSNTGIRIGLLPTPKARTPLGNVMPGGQINVTPPSGPGDRTRLTSDVRLRGACPADLIPVPLGPATIGAISAQSGTSRCPT